MANTYDLRGRAAVVTGAARGIGRAIAERLLAGGASVAVWDRDGSAAAEAVATLSAGGKAVPVAVDVADFASVERARDETVAAFGAIDILVNGAGIGGPISPLWEHGVDAWNDVLRVNLTGPFHCCKAIVPCMIARNYGRIANIASIAGKEGNPNASAYSASKAGLIGLTKSLGKELAGYNISVNALTPAVAMTPLLDGLTEEHIRYMLSRIPRGRAVLVEEIAATVAFMVSEDCSFTTGFTFDISGGRATY